jgi:hypothetical protein
VRVKWKRALWIAGGLFVLVGLAVVVAFSRGSYGRIALGSDGRASSPAAAACLSRQPRADRRLLERCVRVRGILLYVRRRHDGEGRVDEIHLLVSAHFHLYVVKLIPPFSQHLALGHEVVAVGPLLETHPSRFGIHEVEAFSFSGGS